MLQEDYGQGKCVLDKIQRPQRQKKMLKTEHKQIKIKREGFMWKLGFPTESFWDLSVPPE